jgi:hypothetical protein
MTSRIETNDPATHLWACDCPPCRDRRARYKKNWRLNQHRGIPVALTDPEPTLNHIRNALLPAAWTRMQIGYAAGLDPSYIAELLGEQSKATPSRIRIETANAILGLGPADRLRNVPDHAPVDRTGTRRRLQALAVKGQNLAGLLREMHCSNGVMSGQWISAGNARRIAEVYNRLWSVEGPSKIGAIRARNRGWVGPGAWDDATIDDPRTFPDFTGRCGTPQGYQAHRGSGIPACRPCKDAEAVASAERKARRATAARQELAA